MGRSPDGVRRGPDLCIVLVTHPRRGARAFARELVEQRLAACVNLVPAASLFLWRGDVDVASETLLIVKTRSGRVRALERHLAAEHPYDVPECIVLDPVHVERRYLAWLRSELAESEKRTPRRARTRARTHPSSQRTMPRPSASAFVLSLSAARR